MHKHYFLNPCSFLLLLVTWCYLLLDTPLKAWAIMKFYYYVTNLSKKIQSSWIQYYQQLYETQSICIQIIYLFPWPRLDFSYVKPQMSWLSLIQLIMQLFSLTFPAFLDCPNHVCNSHSQSLPLLKRWNINIIWEYYLTRSHTW